MKRTRGLKVKRILGVAATLVLCLTIAARTAQADEIRGAIRLGGSDRYQTMSKIVSSGFSQADSVVIATGQNFPDALSASALAGSLSCPVILTSGQSLSAEASSEITRLKPTSAYIMGGPGAVSEAVESQIKSLGLTSVQRIAGADRVSTSIEALKSVREAGSTSDTVILATGKGFADALAIGPWSYKTASPIVLVANDSKLTDAAVSAIKADPAIKNILIVGGTRAVSDDAEQKLADAYHIERLQGEDRYATAVAIANWEVAHGLNWQYPAVATGQNFPDALAGAAYCGSKGSPILLTNKRSPSAISTIASNHESVQTCAVLGGASAVSYAQLVQLDYVITTNPACPFSFEDLDRYMTGIGVYTTNGSVGVAGSYILKNADGKKAFVFIRKPYEHRSDMGVGFQDTSLFDVKAGDSFAGLEVVSVQDPDLTLRIDNVQGDVEFQDGEKHKGEIVWLNGLVNGSEIETIWKNIADFLIGSARD